MPIGSAYFVRDEADFLCARPQNEICRWRSMRAAQQVGENLPYSIGIIKNKGEEKHGKKIIYIRVSDGRPS